MDWDTALREYALWWTASGSSAATMRVRRHYLLRLARHIPRPWDARPAQLVAFLARDGWSPETRKSCRAAVRSFYRWGTESGYLDADPSTRLPAVRVPPTVARPVPDHLVSSALFRAGDRDRLMVALAACAGLRRNEIATLRTSDLVGDLLFVRGKGGKERLIPVVEPLLSHLRAVPAGFFFPGKIDGHLSADRVGHILARLLGDGWSGHKLRHRFASTAYSADQDLLAVQRLLGHSRPETTRRYVSVPDASLRAAVAAAGRLVA